MTAKKNPSSSKGHKKKTAQKKVKASLQSGVSPQQWALPAGYRADGAGLLSLTDLLNTPEVDVKPLSDLTEDQQAELTAQRIRGQKSFSIGIVGVGILDKERAIAEVQARSSAGKTLIEIEKRTIKIVLEAARAAARKEAT